MIQEPQGVLEGRIQRVLLCHELRQVLFAAHHVASRFPGFQPHKRNSREDKSRKKKKENLLSVREAPSWENLREEKTMLPSALALEEHSPVLAEHARTLSLPRSLSHVRARAHVHTHTQAHAHTTSV